MGDGTVVKKLLLCECHWIAAVLLGAVGSCCGELPWGADGEELLWGADGEELLLGSCW